MLVLFWEVDQMQVALKLISTILLDGSLKSYQGYVLVLFNLPLLLSFLAPFGNSVMFPVLNSGIDHLVIKFIWVSLPCLLTQLLDNVLFRVIVLGSTIIISFFL